MLHARAAVGLRDSGRVWRDQLMPQVLGALAGLAKRDPSREDLLLPAREACEDASEFIRLHPSGDQVYELGLVCVAQAKLALSQAHVAQKHGLDASKFAQEVLDF